MSVLCGWASQSENGTVNGLKGDQTGKEVKTGAYYNFGQNQVIRFKDASKAAIAAKAVKGICDNNNDGYGQSDRTTLFSECQRIGWDVNRIGEIRLCNSDCSEVSLCAINFAYGKELIPATATTRNIAQLCQKTGLFDIVTSFNESTLQIGDMPLKAGKHIITVLQNGSSVVTKTVNSTPTVTSSSSASNDNLRDLQGAITDDKIATLDRDGLYGKCTDAALKKIVVKSGSKGNVVAWVQCRVGCTPDGVAGSKTKSAIIAYQKKKGLTADGIAGYNTIRAILKDYGCKC